MSSRRRALRSARKHQQTQETTEKEIIESKSEDVAVELVSSKVSTTLKIFQLKPLCLGDSLSIISYN
jgi:hypothetical protein